MIGRRPVGLSSLFLLPLLVLVVGACAASTPATPVPQPAAPADEEFEFDASGDTLDDGLRAGDGNGEPEAAADPGIRDGALIVYTGRLRLEVDAIEPKVQAATDLIVGLGGYVAASQEQNTTAQHSASVTYRVPASAWNDAVRGLRALAERVVNEHTESAEVTAEVIDLEARIANLRASESALQEIMTRAGTIDDVLKVQRELSSVRSQIEQLTAQRDHLRDRAAYGTLTVTFETPVVAADVAQEGWHLGSEVDRALADLIRITQALTSLAVWLGIVVVPVLLPLALVAIVALRLRRRFAPTSSPPDRLTPSV